MLKNTSSTDERFMIFAGECSAKPKRGVAKRMAKISFARTAAANSQVRQLDSTCNLIFTLVPLKLGHYCRIRPVQRRRSRLFRTTASAENAVPRFLEVLKSVRSFNAAVHEFMSEVFSLSLVLSLFLRLNFGENAKNTRRSERSNREPP